MNRKRVWEGMALLLGLACMTGQLSGCSGQEGVSVPEHESISADENTFTFAENDWYELDPEKGILTVRIPDDMPGSAWSFVIGDQTVLELLTQETTENTYVASFRALDDGETSIIFSYVKNDALNQARTLQVQCREGKVVQAAVQSEMEMSVEGVDDPEIERLRENNGILNILKEHSAVTCVSETWDGDNNWQYMTVTQFVRNSGRLWYDYEQYDDANEVVYCEAGYINDDVSGAMYLVETDGAKYMEVCPSVQYESLIAEQWLRRSPADYELYIDSEISTEYGSTTVIARRVNDLTGVCADVFYFTDSTTGLLNGMEITEYSSEDPSQTVSVTRSNVLYDEPRLLEERATMEVLFPDDACYLNVVVNPGQNNEEELSYAIAKDTKVEFVAKGNFELFFDYACEQPMEWIDVAQNKLTVYVKMEP